MELKKPIPWYVVAKSRMRSHNIRVLDVAAALNVTASAAGHYLSGRRQPSPQQLIKIAEVLGISMSELTENAPRFARNRFEADVLDLIHDIQEDQQGQALKLIRAVLGAVSPAQEESPQDAH